MNRSDADRARSRPIIALRFLTAGSVDDGKSTLIGRAAVRQPRDPRRPARHAARQGARASRSTCRCSPTGWRPSANRASRSTWRTATSPPGSASSSSPTRRATSSTRATWSPPPQAAMPPWCWWTSPRSTGAPPPVAVAAANAPPCAAGTAACACRASCSRSTRLDAVERRRRCVLQPFARAAALRQATPASTWPASCRCRRCAATTSTQPLRAPWFNGPSLLRTAGATADHRRNASTGALAHAGARTSPATAKAVGHQARTLWGRIARGRVQRRRRGAAAARAATPRVVQSVLRPGNRCRSASAGESAGLVLDRQLDVSRGDWIVSTELAAREPQLRGDARLARHRAGADRPQATGCATATAGCRRASAQHRAPARHPHAAAHRCARSSRSTRSAR